MAVNFWLGFSFGPHFNESLGWTMVFKAVSGVARDAYEVYNSAFTYSEKAMAALDVTNNYGDHYKNRIILNWNNFGPSEVKLSFAGHTVRYLWSSVSFFQ